MKYQLHRKLDRAAIENGSWEIERVPEDMVKLKEFLYDVLVDTMSNSLDPDLKGMLPNKYIENLTLNRLGDFSRRYIITARDNEKVIGILIALPELNKNTFHIYTLGVSEGYRGKGVGQALLCRGLNDLCKLGYEDVIIDVHSDNIPALNLYRKLGFSDRD